MSGVVKLTMSAETVRRLALIGIDVLDPMDANLIKFLINTGELRRKGDELIWE